jgi:hypothetical protein
MACGILTIRTTRVQHSRKITDISSNKTDLTGETTLELDSHADTCVLGRDALIILNYDRPVDVEGYDPSLGKQCYDQQTGKVFHLVINQAIHIPHLDHHLLCPMQCRVNDVTVGETPKFLVPNPTDKTHALTITDNNDPTQAVHLPLALRGVTSLLYMWKPMVAEWESDQFPRYHLTSESLTWDPTTTTYEEQELAMVNHHGNIIHTSDFPARGCLVINALSSLIMDTADITDDDNFHVVLNSQAHISSVETLSNGHFTTQQKRPIDHMTLAFQWMIAPEKALQTVNVTTQRGVRTCVNPTLSRRFPTNDRLLHSPDSRTICLQIRWWQGQSPARATSTICCTLWMDACIPNEEKRQHT